MKTHVLGVRSAKMEVAWIVVCLAMVKVVHLLAPLQRPPDNTLHYKDMIENIPLAIRTGVVGAQNLLVSLFQDVWRFCCQSCTRLGAILGSWIVPAKRLPALSAFIFRRGSYKREATFFQRASRKCAMRYNGAAPVGAVICAGESTEKDAANTAFSIGPRRNYTPVLKIILPLKRRIASHSTKRTLGVFGNRSTNLVFAMGTGFHACKYSNKIDTYNDGNHYEIMPEPQRPWEPGDSP